MARPKAAAKKTSSSKKTSSGGALGARPLVDEEYEDVALPVDTVDDGGKDPSGSHRITAHDGTPRDPDAEQKRKDAEAKAKADEAAKKAAEEAERIRKEAEAKAAAEAELRKEAEQKKRGAIEAAELAVKLPHTTDRWQQITQAQAAVSDFVTADATAARLHDQLADRRIERNHFLNAVDPVGIYGFVQIADRGDTSHIPIEAVKETRTRLNMGLSLGHYPVSKEEIEDYVRKLDAEIRYRGEKAEVGSHPTMAAIPTPAPAPSPIPAASAAAPAKATAVAEARAEPKSRAKSVLGWLLAILFGLFLLALVIWGFVRVTKWALDHVNHVTESAPVVQDVTKATTKVPVPTPVAVPVAVPTPTPTNVPTVTAPVMVVAPNASTTACVPLTAMPGAHCDDSPGYAGDINCARRIRNFELRQEVENAQVATPNANTPRVFCPTGVYNRVNDRLDPIADGTYDYHDCTFCPPGAPNP